MLLRPAPTAAAAGRLERLGGRASAALGRPAPVGLARRVEEFRATSVAVLERRWWRLSLAALASHLALFAVLLTALRCTDGPAAEGTSTLQLLAVFAVTRLLTAVPVTPGSVGVAEASYVAGLGAVGVAAAPAAAAALLFRFLTWFVPVPVGAGCWWAWRRGVSRRPPPS